MKIVNTSRTTYLCEDAVEEGGKYQLTGALAFSDWSQLSVRDTAERYVLQRIEGRVVSITIGAQLVESVSEDNFELGPQIRVLEGFVPIAEKQARSKLVRQELLTLMAGTKK